MSTRPAGVGSRGVGICDKRVLGQPVIGIAHSPGIGWVFGMVSLLSDVKAVARGDSGVAERWYRNRYRNQLNTY